MFQEKMLHKENTTPAGKCNNHITSDLLYEKNFAVLSAEMDWVQALIAERVEYLINNPGDDIRTVEEIVQIPLFEEGNYATLIQEYSLGIPERLIITLCFMQNHIPGFFNILKTARTKYKDSSPSIGGIMDNSADEFVPTLQTALFILAAQNYNRKVYFESLLRDSNPVFKEQIVHLIPVNTYANSRIKSILKIDDSYYNYLRYGNRPRLDYNDGFPALLLETEKTFADIVLSESIHRQLKAAMDFVTYNKQLFCDHETVRKINPGYVLLLYGPPGTGKTLTVSVLGNELDIDVYKVHLPRVISKYIGETEKNLEKVFNRLEGKECILFFDEADALFGKRTDIIDAKDRYANQEVSYLLQKIEKWNGLVILATNFEQNLDTAFERRILTKVRYKEPDQNERLKLWHTLLPSRFTFEPENLAERLAGHYQFKGGNIAKIIKLACIEAVSRDSTKITAEILAPVLKKEAVLENIPYTAV